MSTIKEILDIYSKTESIRMTAKEAGCSWNKVVKAISSAGLIANENHALILKLHDEGRTVDEIASDTGFSVKTIKSYLPRVRPPYGENRSKNAITIEKSRMKHKN